MKKEITIKMAKIVFDQEMISYKHSQKKKAEYIIIILNTLQFML
jgi:hypothetical protein